MAVTFARGFRAGTAACGVKAFTAGATAIPTSQRDDLCVVQSDHGCDTGGVFTTNKVKSAPVIIDRLHLQPNRVRAITINSGNANSCTGAQGFKDALLMAKLTADRLDLDPHQVLVSSTGVIGRNLPMAAIKTGIIEACAQLSTDGGDRAARAIMTTDTVPKTAQLEVDIAETTIRVGGMCKGSGMIHPNMGTLLAYITTDAAVESGLMAKLVKPIADRSFNQVTVDGDSSTNDTFLMLANGAAGNQAIRAGSVEAELFEAALLEVARQLARAVASDGEGASKLISVRVVDALSDADARTAARAVASSSLVKAAVHGGDPNWGRIVCA
ncbi:MAG: bifunctional glutamate N-acetyltransferase/amino-acid acetyltransferase ArgJ, partial [Candidatus Dormiibacterota bacterium]